MRPGPAKNSNSLLPSDATEAEAAVSVVVALWVDDCGAEGQAASELTGVHRTGPVEADAACAQQGSITDVARSGEVEWGRHETTSIIRGVTIVEDIETTEFISRAGSSAWGVGDGGEAPGFGADGVLRVGGGVVMGGSIERGGVVGGDGSGPVVVIWHDPTKCLRCIAWCTGVLMLGGFSDRSLRLCSH